MKQSSDRILSTHTGSLPRPDDLVRLMFAKEEGVPIDLDALHDRIRIAVGEIVAQQVEAQIDVISDGEVSKPGYATYVKDRLDGFGGESQPLQYADLVDFPAVARRVFDDPGRSRRRAPACDAPIGVRDSRAVARDVDNLRGGLAAANYEDAFLTAASPGVISLFFRNDYYASHEAYLFAIAEAMRAEYQAIVSAGLVLQVDCPDLAMGRHIQFARASLEEFRRNVGMHVEALNFALAGIPEDQVRIHLCWGNYEGPHHYDVDLRDILDIVLAVRADGISIEAANPRHEHEWVVFEDVKLPASKVLIPGVIDSTTNYIEHPDLVAQRIVRLARLVGRERVIAGTDCGFGTWVGMARVDAQVVWAKLRSLAEGARRASQQLW